MYKAIVVGYVALWMLALSGYAHSWPRSCITDDKSGVTTCY